MLQQMIGAARLDRTFYTRLIFDDYATGNAVLVVALVHLVVAAVRILGPSLLGLGAVFFLLRAVLFGAIGWLVLALVMWLVGTKLFPGHAQAQTVMRLTGFAHVPLLALALDEVLPRLGTVVALVWFGAALVVAAEAVLSVDRRQAILSTLAGLLVWLVFFRPF